MKTQILGALCFALWTPLALAQTTSSQSEKRGDFPQRTLNVAVVIYPDMNALDATGPVEVFDTANGLAPHAFNVYTLAQTSAPITPFGGSYSLTPRYTFTGAPRPDILIVPGAPMPTIALMEKNRAFLDYVRSQSKAPVLMSVCTGSFLLARAGVLDGKRATTHWFCTEDLANEFPRVAVRQNVRFVEDGNLLTTAGVSSGIDGALRVIERTRGAALSESVARVIQYRPGTPAFPQVKATASSAPLKKGQKLANVFDPVCGMKLGPNVKTTFAYNGQIYGFCGPGCRDAFAANPASYLKHK